MGQLQLKSEGYYGGFGLSSLHSKEISAFGKILEHISYLE